MAKTNAVRILEAAGIPFELREYQVDEDDLSAPRVAEKIGMPARAGLQNTGGAWRSHRRVDGMHTGE